MYIPKTVLVVLALLAVGWWFMNPAMREADTGVVTSWDGRQIHGEVTGYHDWGIEFQREDGYTVRVPWKMMSAGDAEKFREMGRKGGEDAETRRGGDGEKKSEGFWEWLQR
jgi:hypothetical protein